MIDTVLLFATEAKEAAEEGFGLNPDLLSTNLFNLAILLGLVVFYGRKVLGNILGDRRAKIAEAISEAENRKNKAAAALAVEQKKLAEAKAEAERIIAAASERAKVVTDEINARAVEDIKRLQESAAKDLGAEQEKVLIELRQRITALALERVRERLSGGLDEAAQQNLIERSLAQLGGR